MALGVKTIGGDATAVSGPTPSSSTSLLLLAKQSVGRGWSIDFATVFSVPIGRFEQLVDLNGWIGVGNCLLDVWLRRAAVMKGMASMSSMEYIWVSLKDFFEAVKYTVDLLVSCF